MEETSALVSSSLPADAACRHRGAALPMLSVGLLQRDENSWLVCGNNIEGVAKDDCPPHPLTVQTDVDKKGFICITPEVFSVMSAERESNGRPMISIETANKPDAVIPVFVKLAELQRPPPLPSPCVCGGHSRWEKMPGISGHFTLEVLSPHTL